MLFSSRQQLFQQLYTCGMHDLWEFRSATVRKLQAHQLSIDKETTRRYANHQNIREYTDQKTVVLTAVSYTHLDVYKRQDSPSV